MSRKPTIKISYPDASTLAMQLTGAMIRRAPGKRVLETTSEDKAGDGEGSLLDGLNSVRTSTSVEMTLKLEPNSMDYVLQQLIRPNLTEEEKKAIFGESASADEMLPGSDPAEEHTAPDQEKQIEIGKIPDCELRIILADLIHNVQAGGETADHIQDTINAINDAAGVIDLDETYDEERDYSYKTYALIGLILTRIEMLKATKNPSPQNTLVLLGLDLKDHLKRFEHDPEGAFLDAYQVAYPRRNLYPATPTEEKIMVDDLTKFLYRHDPVRSAGDDLSWEDVEKEAREIGKPKFDTALENQPARTLAKPAEADIEPGLLNDIEDGEEGGA